MSCCGQWGSPIVIFTCGHFTMQPSAACPFFFHFALIFWLPIGHNFWPYPLLCIIAKRFIFWWLSGRSRLVPIDKWYILCLHGGVTLLVGVNQLEGTKIRNLQLTLVRKEQKSDSASSISTYTPPPPLHLSHVKGSNICCCLLFLNLVPQAWVSGIIIHTPAC